MYQQKHVYTEKELLECDIADLETDVKCAIRDGLTDYAILQGIKLLAKKEELKNLE